MLSSTSAAPRESAAAAQMTGTRVPATVPRRSAPRISSAESSVPSRYFSISESSVSAAASARAVRARATSATIPAGRSVGVAPPSVPKRWALPSTRST